MTEVLTRRADAPEAGAAAVRRADPHVRGLLPPVSRHGNGSPAPRVLQDIDRSMEGVMRHPYVADHLEAAARDLNGEEDLHARLYAAHLKLHTVLPQDFPEGPLRRAYEDIHNRFTKRHMGDAHESSVIQVLAGMNEGQAAMLAHDIAALCEAVHAYVRADGAA